jgi:hypothetical protein
MMRMGFEGNVSAAAWPTVMVAAPRVAIETNRDVRSLDDCNVIVRLLLGNI